MKRLYYMKYPKMWRGIGEIMCRHDDLTNMLLSKEIPRVNHPGLFPIFEFAIANDIPCLVHHNSTASATMTATSSTSTRSRSSSKEAHFHSSHLPFRTSLYAHLLSLRRLLYALSFSLSTGTRLKFVWVHAGVSRRCSEPLHHEMISSMCDTQGSSHSAHRPVLHAMPL